MFNDIFLYLRCKIEFKAKYQFEPKVVSLVP